MLRNMRTVESAVGCWSINAGVGAAGVYRVLIFKTPMSSVQRKVEGGERFVW